MSSQATDKQRGDEQPACRLGKTLRTPRGHYGAYRRNTECWKDQHVAKEQPFFPSVKITWFCCSFHSGAIFFRGVNLIPFNGSASRFIFKHTRNIGNNCACPISSTWSIFFPLSHSSSARGTKKQIRYSKHNVVKVTVDLLLFSVCLNNCSLTRAVSVAQSS